MANYGIYAERANAINQKLNAAKTELESVVKKDNESMDITTTVNSVRTSGGGVDALSQFTLQSQSIIQSMTVTEIGLIESIVPEVYSEGERKDRELREAEKKKEQEEKTKTE